MPADERVRLFPAHAVMILIKEISGKTGETVPRTRGDDPAIERIMKEGGYCSPHTRG